MFDLFWHNLPVAWWKGLRDVADSARSYVETDGDIHRLVLKKVTYGDAGTYTVKVSNVYGNQKSYCTVRVSKTSWEHFITQNSSLYQLLQVFNWLRIV